MINVIDLIRLVCMHHKKSANFSRELLDEGKNEFNLAFRQREFGAEDGGLFGGESSFALD